MAARVSDPLRVLGDGRAVHTGKERTGIRSLHRKHCPNVKDRTHNANLPAGNSTEGGKSKGLSVPQPLWDARRGVPEAVLGRHPEGCRLWGGPGERSRI